MPDILKLTVFATAFWASGVRLATATAYATLGEIISEKAGIVNIGLEGMMLSGAFTAALVSYLTGNVWIAVLAAGVIGTLVALLHCIVSVYLAVNQVVSGVAINIMAAGLTTFLSRLLLKNVSAVNSFNSIKIPLLSDIPLVGPVLFIQNILVYILYILVPITWVLLKKTNVGLIFRAVGDYPQAADSKGINVKRYKTIATCICGFLAAVGGAYMSIGTLSMFSENLTSGYGYIALAIVIVGNWKPGISVIAALFFGLIQAFTYSFQVVYPNATYQLVLMLPYLFTIVIYAIFSKKVDMPGALGKPFIK